MAQSSDNESGRGTKPASLLLVSALLLFATHLSAQKAPEVLSSVPLPGELSYKNAEPRMTWEPGMMQCDVSGNLFVLRSSHHELLKIGLNGGVALRIDVSGLAGLGDAEVHSFASGPNGELYVMASHVVYYEIKRADPNKPPRKTRWSDAHSTLLRFDANGELILSKRIDQPYEVPWIAVFDSGDFLLLDSNGDKGAVARFYSSEGSLQKQIALTDKALVDHDNGEIYLLGSGDKAFLVVQWNTPGEEVGVAVATVSRDAKVLGSSIVTLPKVITPINKYAGYISYPRRRGDHILAKVNSLPEGLIELDPMGGKVVAQYEDIRNDTVLGCETPDGMSFINALDQKLEVMALQPKH